jgi:hypothetical protein
MKLRMESSGSWVVSSTMELVPGLLLDRFWRSGDVVRTELDDDGQMVLHGSVQSTSPEDGGLG